MIRALPIHVEPLPAETTDGYLGRLARKHLLAVNDIRRPILQEVERSTWNGQDPGTVRVLAQTAGLPVHALEVSFDEHGMWTRCGHPRWSPTKCPRCQKFTEPHTACSICAGGMSTTTRARKGPLCLLHSRWSLGAFETDMAITSRTEAAEQTLVGILWERGITLHTGELNLAAAAIMAWARGTESPTFLDDNAARFGLASVTNFDQVLLCAYPEVVHITELITSPRVLRGVLQVAMSALPQIDVFANVIAQTLGARVNDNLHDFARDVVGHAHRAVLYAAGLRRTRTTTHALCPRDRALIVASGLKRACLLRHAPPRLLDGLRRGHTDGTPRPRTTRRRPLEIDELALA